MGLNWNKMLQIAEKPVNNIEHIVQKIQLREWLRRNKNNLLHIVLSDI